MVPSNPLLQFAWPRLLQYSTRAPVHPSSHAQRGTALRIYNIGMEACVVARWAYESLSLHHHAASPANPTGQPPATR